MGFFEEQSAKKEIRKRLNKIVLFNSNSQHFNYFIVKGSRRKINMSEKDLIILHHLLVKVGKEKGYDVEWLINPENFVRELRMALSWAHDQSEALIFYYRPSAEVEFANKKYEKYKNRYIDSNTEARYNNMYMAFVELYDLLG